MKEGSRSTPSSVQFQNDWRSASSPLYDAMEFMRINFRYHFQLNVSVSLNEVLRLLNVPYLYTSYCSAHDNELKKFKTSGIYCAVLHFIP